MSLVAVKNLKEGWVLSEDVKDINGRLMLSKGQQINSNNLRILKIWGVPEVSIKEEYKSALYDKGDKDIEKLLRTEHTVKMVMQNIHYLISVGISITL